MSLRGFLLTVVALIFVTVGEAAAIPAPLTNAVAAPPAISIAIIPRGSLHRRSTLLVARALNGGRYRRWRQVRGRGRSSVSLLDAVPAGATRVSYRSKVRGAQTSRWSRAATLVMETAAPTAPDLSPPQEEPRQPQVPPSAPNQPITSPVSNCGAAALDAVHAEVARVRAQSGLPLLTKLSALDVSSQRFADKLSRLQSLSHDGWFENIVASGFGGSTAGQNIGFGLDAKGMMTAWLASPGHRVNILSPDFRWLGVGCTRDARGVVWWVQDFGG